MFNGKTPYLVFSDPSGRIFDHPSLRMAGRSGDRILIPDSSEILPLPQGSQLFTLPGRVPIGWNEDQGNFIPLERISIGRKEIQPMAVAAFLPPGYVRTHLPATRLESKAPVLPLWAYSAVGWKDGKFWVTGFLLDPNPHWNPKYFKNDQLLSQKVASLLRQNPANRLLKHLSRCALEYHCFAAKNLFFRRWECPLPTSPACNASCLGCISLQPSECCPASMERIPFVPTVDEILEVALPHLETAEDAIVSFGQGCEGEPLLQSSLLEESIRKLREKTDRGTIHLNTNGSFPDRVAKLCKAGLDSLRVTLNSANPRYYHLYHQPKGYSFRKVKKSLMMAKEKGIYTSINLLIFPGVSDREKEIERLIQFIEQTEIDLIQMRNLNIDPDLYLKAMGRGEGIGIRRMMDILKREFPRLQFGYFNRTKEDFFRTID